jgi:hypothetical protein
VITQISRIQHRRGLSENLPQLASAEFGWVIDKRKLYIGNGSIAEGAPEVGNTEILTEYSDILGLVSSYTYKGARAGYSVQNTKPRSLQDKLDEYVSVTDFGAVGDGSADDTDAIHAAITQLFIREHNPKSRRTLFFPPGVYNITKAIRLPTYAKLVGAGPDSTVIRQTGTDYVIVTSDSLGQLAPAIGSNSATQPGHSSVSSLTLETKANYHVAKLDSIKDAKFSWVKFVGNFSTVPDQIFSSTACVFLTSTPVNRTYNVSFSNCEFYNNIYGVLADDDMYNIVIEKSHFARLFKAVKLGESYTNKGPVGVKIINSYLSHIYNVAIHSYNKNSVVSSFNTFEECANGLQGDTNPLASVIRFEQSGNYSIGDVFNRPPSVLLVFPNVDVNGRENYYVAASGLIKHGIFEQTPGNQVILLDGRLTPTQIPEVLQYVLDANGAEVKYTIRRGNLVRRGIFHVTSDGTDIEYTDDYNETGNVGVVLQGTLVSGEVKIAYTTTPVGAPATLSYYVNILR